MASKSGGINPQLYVLPAIIYISVFTIFAFAYLFYISTFSYSLYSGGSSSFIGFGNFLNAFNDPLFQKSLLLTLAFGALLTAVEIVLGPPMPLVPNRA